MEVGPVSLSVCHMMVVQGLEVTAVLVWQLMGHSSLADVVSLVELDRRRREPGEDRWDNISLPRLNYPKL